MLTDLFGQPLVVQAPLIHQPRPRRKDPEALRLKALRNELKNPTLLLFDEVLEFLRKPILSITDIPQEYRSDRASVEPAKGEIDEVIGPDIAYQPWGDVWIEDKNGLSWSADGIHHLQKLLFWESMEEMALINNELEKWSVLKWVFRPAIRKYYVWSKKLGRSRGFQEHERDDTFSFHNCSMAVCMKEDVIRDGFSRNLPVELIQQVVAAVKQ